MSGEREKKEKSRKKNFSLRSTKIGPWVLVGTRGKVSPHNEGYVGVPKSRGFVKLQEVGNFYTFIISNLNFI